VSGRVEPLQYEPSAEQVQPASVEELRGPGGQNRNLVIARTGQDTADSLQVSADLTVRHLLEWSVVYKFDRDRGVAVIERLLTAELGEPGGTGNRGRRGRPSWLDTLGACSN
jgi:hypothetical protein